MRQAQRLRDLRLLGSGCPGLHLPGRSVGLRIRMNNVLNDPFSTREYAAGGAQAYGAQKCIGRAELVRVSKIMLDGIS